MQQIASLQGGLQSGITQGIASRAHHQISGLLMCSDKLLASILQALTICIVISKLFVASDIKLSLCLYIWLAISVLWAGYQSWCWKMYVCLETGTTILFCCKGSLAFGMPFPAADAMFVTCSLVFTNR